MAEALALAARGKGFTSPNPCVGALVVRGSEVVGRGYHRRAGGDHAEVIALRGAGRRANGSTLYVTLEPCSHHGRTPPCVDRVIDSGVSRVVVAMADPNPLVRGRGLRRLRQAGIEVATGACREVAQRLNEDFVKFVTAGKPFVTLKLALSLDGKIATRTGDSKWITGPAARARAHQLRHEHDAILVGRGTVKSDDPQLTTRLPRSRRGENPARVIAATGADLKPTARALADDGTARYVLCSAEAARSHGDRLAQRGVEVIPVRKGGGGLDLTQAMDALAKRGLTSVLIEGGSALAASALAAGIVDKAAFFYAPKLLGGTDSLPGIGGRGVSHVNEATTLRDVTVEEIGGDFLVTGYVVS